MGEGPLRHPAPGGGGRWHASLVEVGYAPGGRDRLHDLQFWSSVYIVFPLPKEPGSTLRSKLRRSSRLSLPPIAVDLRA